MIRRTLSRALVILLAAALLLLGTALAASAAPLPAKLTWNSPRTVTTWGNPTNYRAWGVVNVREGNINTARVVVTDADTSAQVCDVGVLWAGPYQAIWSCYVYLTPGVHNLTAQVTGGYISPVVPYRVTVQ